MMNITKQMSNVHVFLSIVGSPMLFSLTIHKILDGYKCNLIRTNHGMISFNVEITMAELTGNSDAGTIGWPIALCFVGIGDER